MFGGKIISSDNNTVGRINVNPSIPCNYAA